MECGCVPKLRGAYLWLRPVVEKRHLRRLREVRRPENSRIQVLRDPNRFYPDAGVLHIRCFNVHVTPFLENESAQ